MTSFMSKIRTSVHGKVALALAGAIVVVVAVAAVAIASGGSSDSSTGAHSSAGVGQPPPEWAANAGSWPAHNYDLVEHARHDADADQLADGLEAEGEVALPASRARARSAPSRRRRSSSTAPSTSRT